MNFKLLALFAAVAGTAAAAAPGGRIDLLKTGSYVCELPGDAAGASSIHQPGEDFAVVNASSYDVAGTRGSYLLTGDRVTLTSGPRRGASYRRASGGTLRQLDAAGRETALYCVRRVAFNG